MTLRSLLLLVPILFLLLSCRKDELFTDDPSAKLVLTEDTILFDTIFTTIGSVTRRFTVRNENENAVKVDIALEGGSPSPFRINVDGASGLTFEDVEILGGDSIFIFVEATLGENGSNDPFIFEDHILLNTNGNQQSVLLVAWGQDAHFFYRDTVIQGFPPIGFIAEENENVHWVNDKPYVIYGCYGVVDDGATLTIDPGVRVYFHGTGSGLWIYIGGRIQALGEQNNLITFQSDRLEEIYEDLPNQWDRIWINEGTQENKLKNCVIKNSLIGIQAQSFSDGQPLSTNTLVLENVSIKNCLTAGLYTENYRIKAQNLLVGDAGQFSVVLTGSGDYDFDHVTIANYWSFEVRQDPAFLLTNKFLDFFGDEQVRTIESSGFRNGIIYGSNTNEFQLAIDESTGPVFEFQHFLFKTDQPTDDPNHFPNQDSIFRNQNPSFRDPSVGDLHLNSGSSAKGKANPTVLVPADLDFKPRPNFGDASDNFLPDLGCYEYYD